MKPTADDIVASISWHYGVGNQTLSTSQLQQHKRDLECWACADKDAPVIRDSTAAALTGGA